MLVQKQADGSEPKGVTIMLAKELGKRLGVPVELVLFNAAGEVFAALKEGRWDIAFLAIEPVRAAEIDFTPPYVIIEGAYMVREGFSAARRRPTSTRRASASRSARARPTTSI